MTGPVGAPVPSPSAPRTMATPPPGDPLAAVAATMGLLSFPLLAVCLLGTLTGTAALACGLISRGRLRVASLEGRPRRGGGWALVGIVSGAGALVSGLVLLWAIAHTSVG